MKHRLAQQLPLFSSSCCSLSARTYATKKPNYPPPRKQEYRTVLDKTGNYETLPSIIQEARKSAEAAIANAPLQSFPKDGNTTTRPQGRSILIGVKRPPRRQPRFEVENIGREDRTHQAQPKATKTVYEKAKPEFRGRGFSTAANAFASTSAVTIEDARRLEEAFWSKRRLGETDYRGSQWEEESLHLEETPFTTKVDEQSAQLTRIQNPGQDEGDHQAQSVRDQWYRRSPLFTRGNQGRWTWYVPPIPRHSSDLDNIIRNVLYYTPGRAGFLALLELHEQYRIHSTTTTYNRLLQAALDMRDMRSFNMLLGEMKERFVEKDSLTWDMLMESYAISGNWVALVNVYEIRQRAGVPLDLKGWTRVARAATRNGTISLLSSEEEEITTNKRMSHRWNDRVSLLSEEVISKKMSPIYNAIYNNNHLPRGVRQISLRQMLEETKTDVDQILAAMMPKNQVGISKRLDFQATLVIAHRLAKQRRWREADDVAAHWLDGIEQERRFLAQQLAEQPQQQAESTSARSIHNEEAESISLDDIQKSYDSLMERTTEESLFLLHVLLEGLVVSRASPENVQAYLENYLERHHTFNARPTYHTIYLVLTSYRGHPLHSRFQAAKSALAQMEEEYKPILMNAEDKHSRKRCLRLIQQYGTLTIQSYGPHTKQKALVDEVRKQVEELHYKEIMSSRNSVRGMRREQHEKDALSGAGRSNHVYAKEVWKHRRLRYKAAWEKHEQTKGTVQSPLSKSLETQAESSAFSLRMPLAQ